MQVQSSVHGVELELTKSGLWMALTVFSEDTEMVINEVNEEFLAQLIAGLHEDRTGNKNQIGSIRKIMAEMMPDILTALGEVSSLAEKNADERCPECNQIL